MTDPTRILVVDDQALFRESIARLLDLQEDFVVVGQAADGAEAITAAGELTPDLVLLDVEMPVLGGIEAAGRIRALLPAVKIVMFTVAEDEDFLVDAVRRGVDGYLLKDMTPDALFDGLREVIAGRSSISPAMVARLFREVREAGARGGDAALAPPPTPAHPQRTAAAPSSAVTGRLLDEGRALLVGDPPLSFRELETMRLVATGMTNKEIGAQLSITEGTVKNHVHNALTKLGMENRIQAAAYIVRHGL